MKPGLYIVFSLLTLLSACSGVTPVRERTTIGDAGHFGRPYAHRT